MFMIQREQSPLCHFSGKLHIHALHMSGTATSQFVLIHLPINMTNNSLNLVYSAKNILFGALKISLGFLYTLASSESD